MINKEILKNYFRVSDVTGTKASLGGLDRYIEDTKGYDGYVVVKPASMEYIEPRDYSIKFIGGGAGSYSSKEVIEALLEIKFDYEVEDLVNNVIETEEMIKDMEDYFEYELEIYENLEKLKEDLSYGLIEFYVDNGYENDLIEANGCYLDTVGYSQWSSFIADNKVDKSFVRDMWEGWNWYSIQLFDLEGNHIDDFGDNHFYDNKEIEEVLVNEFKLKGYKIVEVSSL